MNNRSYNQYCGIAYALDLVGERWTLLLIRELIVGPRRYTDLLVGLPGISTNLLTERLKNLEQHGLIERRVLPPPAGSTVYALTAVGQALEPTLIELGKWGSQFIPAVEHHDAVLPVGSYALTLKTFFRPQLAQDLDETYALHIDGEVLHVHISHGTLVVQQGQPHDPIATFTTTMPTYLALLQGQTLPADASASGDLHIDGDHSAIDRFLAICGIAGPAVP